MEKKETSASEVSQMEDGEEWVDAEREGQKSACVGKHALVSFSVDKEGRQ